MKLWKPALTILCCLSVISDTLTTCPTCNRQPYNLRQKEVNAKYEQMARSVWNQTISLTDLGTAYVAYIKSLNVSRDVNTAMRAYYATLVINYFIPYLNQQPDACSMAAMINATYSCHLDKNSTPLRDALAALQDRYLYEISPRLERTIAHKSGCDVRCGEYPPDPKVNKTVCYGNGFVYPIQQFLNMPSQQFISQRFKTFLIQMYNSTDFNDKFFAACSTFALMGFPFEIWNANIMAEVVDLTTSSQIDRHCCYQRITRAEEIRKIYDADVINYTIYEDEVFEISRCI